MSVANLILLAGAAFVGSLLAAVAGFGGAAILLPLLVAAFGVREAIPILTVAQLLGNLSRAWFSLRFGAALVSYPSSRHFSDRSGRLPPHRHS
jgi:uncharacterized membrane protein YfcA